MTDQDRATIRDLLTRLNLEDVMEVFFEDDIKESGKTEEEVQDILMQAAYMAEGVRDQLSE